MKNITTFKIGSTILDKNSKPYIIAEIGVNHEGSIEKAKDLIKLAKEGGANAAKFQSYKADTLASVNSPAYWDTSKEETQSQHELFKKYDNFNSKEYTELFEFCKKIEIDFMSTPFDDESIDYLYPLVPIYKIASADITNIPFLRKIASKKKPVLISTGASNIDEIDLAIDTLSSFGCDNIALMHCILNYPTPYEFAHLRMIKGLMEKYPDNLIGYSDHTLPNKNMSSLVTSHILGAVIIEKHFTDDKNRAGNDHYHSMDVNDLINFINEVNLIHTSLGPTSKKSSISSEKISRINARRSIVLRKSKLKGETLNETDLTYKRPGTGICPKNWDIVVGSRVKNDLNLDHVLSWEDIHI